MSKAPTPPTDQSAAPAAQRVAPLAHRIDDAATAIGVSNTKVWSLIREGRLPARKLDSLTVIRHEDLIAFVDGLPLVRQLAEPPADPPPPPLPAVPRAAATPSPPSAPARPLAPPVNLRREPPQPRFAPPPPQPTPPDKKAPYGRGRTGKPLPPPNPNGWGIRTLRRPSEQLAAIVGPDPISRPKALERVWKHIHAAGLQRPADMRVIYADEKLRAVAGAEVITMYALEEMIRPHLGLIK